MGAAGASKLSDPAVIAKSACDEAIQTSWIVSHQPALAMTWWFFCGSAITPAYCMNQPWLTTSDWPVSAFDSKPAKNTAAAATS